MRFLRYIILVAVAVGLFYAAAYAAANPDNAFADIVICGAALLVLVLPGLHLFKVGQIIRNAFREGD